jgi:hypothetical protein
MPKTVYTTGDIPTAANFNAFTQEANAAITGGTIGAVTIDSTTNKPVTAASLAGGTLPASVTTLAASGNTGLAVSSGNVGVGMAAASATALVHLKAGSAAAGTAPLKFTSGPLLTTVEEGAIEYQGHTFYATTYLVRRSIALAQSIPIARVAVPASSTTKTLVYSVPMAANYLTAGKKINMRLNGTITQRNNGSSFFTLTLEYAGSAVLTFTTPASTAMAALPFEIDLRSVCRSIGAAGSMISFGKFITNGAVNSSVMGAVTTINTTASNTLSVYITCNENNASTGPVNVEMAETLCLDANT